MFEINKLSVIFHTCDHNLQKVVTASVSGAFNFVPKGVTLVTCAIEAAILLGTDLVRNLVYDSSLKWY